ncbi:MAG: hypothetical protein MZW92_21270 [Comamonadaceae bacterium]|nr:hypothetical protein [Comamonadaceae bacterium]
MKHEAAPDALGARKELRLACPEAELVRPTLTLPPRAVDEGPMGRVRREALGTGNDGDDPLDAQPRACPQQPPQGDSGCLEMLEDVRDDQTAKTPLGDAGQVEIRRIAASLADFQALRRQLPAPAPGSVRSRATPPARVRSSCPAPQPKSIVGPTTSRSTFCR